MNSFLCKNYDNIIPIKYLCDISYNITGKRIFIYSSDKFFSVEDYRNVLENRGEIPRGLNAVDAVIFNKKSIELIEFKSGKYDNISTKLLKDQFIDSKIILNTLDDINTNDIKCILVVEKFIYHLSENLKRLKNKIRKTKCKSTLSFLKERISNINIEIKKNRMEEIKILFVNDFIQKYDVALCDLNNTCTVKPKNISKCEFKH